MRDMPPGRLTVQAFLQRTPRPPPPDPEPIYARPDWEARAGLLPRRHRTMWDRFCELLVG